MSKARLRIFAGPNGSGKSTLFDSFSKKYDAGVFLNADLIENELSTKGFIDLSEFNLNLTQVDLDVFLKSERAVSLLKKSREDNHKIDISLKENIIPIAGALDKVLQLKGVYFNKKETPELTELGFIAQEVEQVIPELVSEMEDGIKTVSYSRVAAVLVETIKEQQAQIEDLKALVAQLSKKLDSL
jgi:AAA15 family ATPase/GTPase